MPVPRSTLLALGACILLAACGGRQATQPTQAESEVSPTPTALEPAPATYSLREATGGQNSAGGADGTAEGVIPPAVRSSPEFQEFLEFKEWQQYQEFLRWRERHRAQ
jgi:hypothetical protein